MNTEQANLQKLILKLDIQIAQDTLKIKLLELQAQKWEIEDAQEDGLSINAAKEFECIEIALENANHYNEANEQSDSILELANAVKTLAEQNKRLLQQIGETHA